MGFFMHGLFCVSAGGKHRWTDNAGFRVTVLSGRAGSCCFFKNLAETDNRLFVLTLLSLPNPNTEGIDRRHWGITVYAEAAAEPY